MTMHTATREQIERLTVDNPIVHAVWTYYSQGVMTWEEAMQTAVLLLATENAQLREELIKAISAGPPRPRL